MRCKTFVLSAALILGAGLFRCAAAEAKPEPSREEGTAGRLVRLDLLRRPPASDVRIRRNIFLIGRPAAETFVEAEGALPEESLPPVAAGDAAGKTSVAEPAFRYIGWVTSSLRAVGLLDTGREILAVSEGETIEGGFVVRSIGPEILELATPEGRILTVSIEGGRR